MAGSSLFTAVLDANVLYPTLTRDLLLSLGQAGLFHARWTNTITEEWVRNLEKNRPDLRGKLGPLVVQMQAAIPDCLIEGYEPLIAAFNMPDPDDAHVVAAAVVGHADAIVTDNLRDFPAELLKPLGISVQTPDEFIANQLQLRELHALTAVKTMRARWKNPALTAEALIDLLKVRGLSLTADLLYDAKGLI